MDAQKSMQSSPKPPVSKQRTAWQLCDWFSGYIWPIRWSRLKSETTEQFVIINVQRNYLSRIYHGNQASGEQLPSQGRPSLDKGLGGVNCNRFHLITRGSPIVHYKLGINKLVTTIIIYRHRPSYLKGRPTLIFYAVEPTRRVAYVVILDI